MPWRRAIVVGASSGIGEAVGRELAERGVQVALVARREDRLQTLRSELNARYGDRCASAYSHDVRNTDEVPALFQRITHDLGGLDLIVYATGMMADEGTDRYPTEDTIQLIETNFSGAVAWLDQAAVRFGIAGEGTIIGISSVAGDRGRRGNPVYGATKAALNSYLSSLSARLRVRGVKVLSARPGYVRTALIENLTLPTFLPVGTPEAAANAILDAAAAGKRVVYVPPRWRFIMLAVRALPAPLFERLNF